MDDDEPDGETKYPYNKKEKIPFIDSLYTTKLLPEGTEFCEVIYSDFCQNEKTRDGNCFQTKAQGCKIYQRYQIIKNYYADGDETLEILSLSDKISPINRG